MPIRQVLCPGYMFFSKECRASTQQQRCVGTWKKGSGFPSPAAEDTWLLETPVAAAGGNAKQIGVREDKDVSAPVHSFL